MSQANAVHMPNLTQLLLHVFFKQNNEILLCSICVSGRFSKMYQKYSFVLQLQVPKYFMFRLFTLTFYYIFRVQREALSPFFNLIMKEATML
jgi:hypothetical protein